MPKAMWNKLFQERDTQKEREEGSKRGRKGREVIIVDNGKICLRSPKEECSRVFHFGMVNSQVASYRKLFGLCFFENK